MPAVRRAHLDRLGRLTRPDGGRCGSLLNLVFEGNTFRIVIGEPAIGRGLANKHLQMFLVANVLARIDVNPDGHRGSHTLHISLRGFERSDLTRMQRAAAIKQVSFASPGVLECPSFLRVLLRMSLAPPPLNTA